LQFALYGIVYAISPAYFAEIRGSPLLVPAVILGFILLAVGNFTIYRMVNFKV
jgi:Flp pilus assembly protein TadB